MKDTQVDAVIAPAGISVSQTEPRLCGGAASPDDKMEVSSQMERYLSSVRLLTSRQLQVRMGAQVRPLLCYPLPAAPLS